jgi:hypothetical protein
MAPATVSTRPKEEPSLQLLGFRLNVVGHYQPATIYLLIDAGLGRHFRPEAPGSPHREAMGPFGAGALRACPFPVP